MDQKEEKKVVDFLFDISLILKGVNAIIEVVLSLVLLFVSKSAVLRYAISITNDELLENKSGRVAHWILDFAHYFSLEGKVFIFLYLMIHGIVKLVVVYGLIKKKYWGYNFAYIVLGLFIVYQMSEYAFTRSPWLLALSLFDVLMIWLVWKEHSYIKKRKHHQTEA